ncbi:hypothetical protein G9A89_000201 [Geosiphon pyriformis]|nr:hypothetical protein G9A89_000201 [Geosiphon pyriformis]
MGSSYIGMIMPIVAGVQKDTSSIHHKPPQTPNKSKGIPNLRIPTPIVGILVQVVTGGLATTRDTKISSEIPLLPLRRARISTTKQTCFGQPFVSVGNLKDPSPYLSMGKEYKMEACIPEVGGGYIDAHPNTEESGSWGGNDKPYLPNRVGFEYCLYPVVRSPYVGLQSPTQFALGGAMGSYQGLCAILSSPIGNELVVVVVMGRVPMRLVKPYWYMGYYGWSQGLWAVGAEELKSVLCLLGTWVWDCKSNTKGLVHRHMEMFTYGSTYGYSLVYWLGYVVKSVTLYMVYYSYSHLSKSNRGALMDPGISTCNTQTPKSSSLSIRFLYKGTTNSMSPSGAGAAGTSLQVHERRARLDVNRLCKNQTTGPSNKYPKGSVEATTGVFDPPCQTQYKSNPIPIKLNLPYTTNQTGSKLARLNQKAPNHNRVQPGYKRPVQYPEGSAKKLFTLLEGIRSYAIVFPNLLSNQGVRGGYPAQMGIGALVGASGQSALPARGLRQLSEAPIKLTNSSIRVSLRVGYLALGPPYPLQDGTSGTRLISGREGSQSRSVPMRARVPPGSKRVVHPVAISTLESLGIKGGGAPICFGTYRVLSIDLGSLDFYIAFVIMGGQAG